ncbi:MAG: hypothetical protein IH813_03315 [Thaumarchaeota archaeon]|nr:MAG: hypothetical protein NPMRth3_810002 [Nitrosopumilales archaeon]MCH8324114.1 hypothetical protein [Nitrososphaerota archaeon]HEU04185.1 hypothetical protein [Nitrosopumilus sp.]
MTNPITAGDDGIKIKPELMEKEKLYHCIFQDKVLLVYKDSQDILNCYEIEEKELVEKVKQNSGNDNLEKIFEEYIERKNLKH